MDLGSTWQLILQRIQIDISAQTFETWFSQTKLLEIKDGVAKIACKNTFIVQTLETRYYNLIQNTLADIHGEKLNLIFLSLPDMIITSSVKSSAKSSLQAKAQSTLISTHEENENLEEIRELAIKRSNLNPKYSFDNYIVGSSNRLAHAAATAVAEKPAAAYNPLFFYGGVGLGKTHLIQAIGHFVLSVNPKTKILYTSLETMLNEFLSAIQERKTNEFKNKYRQLDILIVDDIQFISGKDALQEEFFNTFNVLYQSNKQIIIASDRPPSEISRLEDRIRSRFEGGMIADINAPEYETKVAILTRKLEEKKASLPSAVIGVIAENVESNVRELEGALSKILTYYSISDTPLSLDDIEKILKRDKKNQKKEIKPRDIIKKVSQSFSVSEEELLGQIRTKSIATARQVAMYLMKKELGITLMQIASYLKRQDHTTIIHGIDKIESEIAKNREFKDQIIEIRKSLGE
ncbi:MAG: chromosomal replication initiator protein DnaA [bacterium]